MELRKATKKIIAVTTATAIASASVFGATANYPQNFVSNDTLSATVVVGSDAAASDVSAAESIVSDLENDYSGDSNNVVITYRTASEDGTAVQVIKSSKELNYGEFLENVSEEIDSEEVSFLGSYEFENGKDNEFYEQEVILKNGEFNFGTRDEDNSDEAVDHIWYADGDVYAQYTIEFDSAIATSGTASEDEDDFVGERLQVMGQEFIISEIDASSTQIDSLILLGGADRVALGEGDEIEVSYEGNTYTVVAQTVDGGSGSNQGEAVISVNGVTRTIGEFETKNVGGVTLAVTDIVGSDRDSVKGYVELIVGGSELKLTDGAEVEINDEKVSDFNEDYEVTTVFGSGGFSTIQLEYKVAEDKVLEAGDSLIDPVFEAFELTFNGINDVEYSEVSFTGGENTDELEVVGELDNGDKFDWFTLQFDGADEAGSEDVYVKGTDGDVDHRVYFEGSVDTITVDPLSLAGSTITIDLTDDNGEDSSFFIYESEDEQYLYTVSNFDDTNLELDVEEEISSKTDDEISTNSTRVIGTLNTALEIKNFATLLNTTTTIDLSSISGNQAVVRLANDVEFGFTNSENVSAGNDTSGYMMISLNNDADSDEDADITANSFQVKYQALIAADGDDEFNVMVDENASIFVNLNPSDLADENADSDDTRILVTKYGTKVFADVDEEDSVKVMTPSEQVNADVSLVFGEAGSLVDLVVSADEADAKVAELEASGAMIVGVADVAGNDVTVEVAAPVTDADVESMMDLIVVGGPAVNSVARDLLGIETYTMDQAGVDAGQYVHRYFEDSNVVLVYGYSAADTTAGVNALNSGNTDFE